MRNGGLAHAEQVADAADAHFAFRKGSEYADSGGVAEDFEHLRNLYEDFVAWHTCLCLLNDMCVFGMNIRHESFSPLTYFEMNI